MRRVLGAFAVATVAWGLVATSAAADPNTTFVFHFKGRAGAAILTDCVPGSPAGTHCRAVDVFAFEERVNVDGDQMGGPGLFVTFFDVELTGAQPPFIAVPIGQGFTENATVRIASLSHGSASAMDVALCEEFDCPPGAPESLSIEVNWVGFGKTTTFKSHDKFSDPFCFINSHSKGAIRDADATGFLDGVAVVEPNLPEFQATLQTDKFGTVERCTSP